MIYIQSKYDTIKKETLPHHFDVACALYGAEDSAMDFRLTSFEEVASGKFDALIRRNLFVGSVEFMREVFKRIGLNDVRLPMNSDRKSEIITIGEALKRVADGKKLFIKPLEIKLFTGFVHEGYDYTCLHGLSEDTKVMVYEPFEETILSEWRLYVHNHKIIDSRNYSGDFMKNPDYQNANEIVEKNKSNFPCAYTIDVGILSNDENVVVEYNNMVSIGNYGIPNDLYLKLLKDCYFGIVR